MLLWDLETERVIERWEMPVERLSFSPTSTRMAWDNAITGEVMVWDITGDRLHTFEQFRAISSQIHVSRDGDTLITYGARSSIDIWEITASGIHHRHTIPNQSVDLVGDVWIVTQSGQGFELWEVSSGLRRLEIENPYTCREPIVSSSSQYLACSVDPATPNERLIIWDLETGEERFSIPLFGLELAFNAQDERIAVGGRDRMELWQLDEPMQIERILWERSADSV